MSVDPIVPKVVDEKNDTFVLLDTELNLGMKNVYTVYDSSSELFLCYTSTGERANYHWRDAPNMFWPFDRISDILDSVRMVFDHEVLGEDIIIVPLNVYYSNDLNVTPADIYLEPRFSEAIKYMDLVDGND